MIGVFARIGAIALNAVHDAAQVGDVVAVFGQGVPGLLVTQLLGLAGASVIAVDAIPRRLELARRFGADHVVDFTVDQPAELIKDLTSGRGADVSIEISGSYRALHEAIRATAYNSRVVVSGFPQGEAVGLFLGEEFHHNRIAVVCSQISEPAPSWITGGTLPGSSAPSSSSPPPAVSTSPRWSRTRFPPPTWRRPSPSSPSRRRRPCRWCSTSPSRR